MPESESILVQQCLDRVRVGEDAAWDDLLSVAGRRLERLARHMLRDFPGVRRWEQTGDVAQGAAIRLQRAIRAEVPGTPRDFFRLAALQIRRELIDLARHHFGPHGDAAHHLSDHPALGSASNNPPAIPADETHDPTVLASWTEFHEQVESLPQEERDVFDLLWYQGLTQPEAAELLDVPLRTLKYRWRSARLRMTELLGGRMPGES